MFYYVHELSLTFPPTISFFAPHFPSQTPHPPSLLPLHLAKSQNRKIAYWQNRTTVVCCSNSSTRGEPHLLSARVIITVPLEGPHAALRNAPIHLVEGDHLPRVVDLPVLRLRATALHASDTSQTCPQTDETTRIFDRTQVRRPSPPASSAWVVTATNSPSAQAPPYGTELKPTPNVAERRWSSRPLEKPSVSPGTTPAGATTSHTANVTYARDADPRRTELNAAISQRRRTPCTPLKADVWEAYLVESGLIEKYPYIPRSIRSGFFIGVRQIFFTFTPPNRPAVHEFADAFRSIIKKEVDSGRYLGPFSKQHLEDCIGPFQSSPLSLVPKAGKPGKFRLTQNLSHPHSTIASTVASVSPSTSEIPHSISSINSSIEASDFPCTWGTFTVVSLWIWQLPPDSELACRDIADAFRSVPSDPSQWPGAVVRASEDEFFVDTNVMFGIASGVGVHGSVADAGIDLFRWRGMGPASKWVDDHLFARILRKHLLQYNQKRAAAHRRIQKSGGRRQSGSRFWYAGDALPDERIEQFDEDCSFPLQDLSSRSPRSLEDAQFTYCMADIDDLSVELGLVWGKDKDVSFRCVCPFTGLEWDVATRTVSVGLAKKTKYLGAIAEWRQRSRHTLQDTQKLHGKLMHVCQVIPRGRAYLTNLEALLRLCHDRPFVPITPPAGTPADLDWWQSTLSRQSLSRSLFCPTEVSDPHAFSDASSGIGVGIVIGGRWRAWRLVPGWKQDRRDIGWAEAVGFELLVRTLFNLAHCPRHVKVYGDNKGVVEGWWKSRSRNPSVNAVFRRMHDTLEANGGHVYTRYVSTHHNPADEPSRGIYGPASLLLPPLSLPPELAPYLVDFDAPLTLREQAGITNGTLVPELKVRENQTTVRAFEINEELSSIGHRLVSDERYWWD